MAAPAEIAVPLERIGVRRKAAGTVAVVGNPNAGKSSVFNRLTGLRQHTANYPGVTVERRIGRGTFGGVSLDLIDLPGTYSLSPTSADEQIAVDVLFGRVAGTPRPEAILAVIDSTRLYQGLYLAPAAHRPRPADDRRADDDRCGRARRAQDRLRVGCKRRSAACRCFPSSRPRAVGSRRSTRRSREFSRCRRRAKRRIGPSCAARRTRSSRSGARPASSCIAWRPSGY